MVRSDECDVETWGIAGEATQTFQEVSAEITHLWPQYGESAGIRSPATSGALSGARRFAGRGGRSGSDETASNAGATEPAAAGIAWHCASARSRSHTQGTD